MPKVLVMPGLVPGIYAFKTWIAWWRVHGMMGTLAGTPIVDGSFDRGHLGPASVAV